MNKFNKACVNQCTALRIKKDSQNRNIAKIIYAINARKNEKITCGCGAVHCRNDGAHHRRTKMHQRWVSENIQS